MPHLSGRGRETVERVRALCRDAGRADLLAERALAALDRGVPFDEGAIFAVDPDSLLFTRLLAYRGPSLQGYAAWLRDMYLVAGEVGALHVPTLLRHGGVAAMHERADRWLRSPPPAPGPVLDRVAPSLARALADRLQGPRARDDLPPPGHLVFDERRRIVTLSSFARQWLALLPDDVGGALGTVGAPAVPVGAQSVVGSLAGSKAASARATMTTLTGARATVTGERALHVGPSGPSTAYSVTVAAAPPLPPDAGSLTATQWQVARAVAAGHSDREIADRMHLSVHTVHERVAALHELCGTHTRPQLVAALSAAAAVAPHSGSQ